MLKISIRLFLNATGFILRFRYNFERAHEKGVYEMAGEGTYLDLNLLINGGMDAFLLVLTGRLLHFPVRRLGVLVGSLLGGLPVVFAVIGPPEMLIFSKIVVPLFMLRAAYGPVGLRSFFKLLLGFLLVSAGLGGIIQALWEWAQFHVSPAGTTLALAMHNLWILPVAAFLWWISQTLWQRWQSERFQQQTSIYEVEIDFGGNADLVMVKALLDTGNSLRDPVTGAPVLILEAAAAVEVLPNDLKEFLSLPWREAKNPWRFLVAKPERLKRLVFIPYQGLGGENWLLGIRPKGICRQNGAKKTPLKATVALVEQVLSQEGAFQALLHQEHVHKGVESR